MGWRPGQGPPEEREVPAVTPPRRRRRKPVAVTEEVQTSGETVEDSQGVETLPAPGAVVQPGRRRGSGGDPRNPIKVELGQRWSQIVTEVRQGQYTWQEFCAGLSEEELARGQLKSVNGNFEGRPPALVPREFHLTCFRELKKRFDIEFQKDVVELTREYLRIAKSPNTDEKTRTKMMQYAMERVFGGIPKEVLVTQDKAWETVLVDVTHDAGEERPEWRQERFGRYAERAGEEGQNG